VISGQSSGRAGGAWNCCVGIAVTLAVFVLVEVLAGTPLAIPNPGPVYLLAVVFAAFSGGIGAGLVSAIVALAGSALNLSSVGQPLLHYSDFDRTRLIIIGIVSPAMAVLVGILKRRADAYHERARAALVREAAFEVCRDAAAKAENALAERDVILRTVPVGISFLRERKHVWVNRAYAEISGFEMGEMIGRGIRSMYTSQEEYEFVGREGYAKLAQGEQYRKELQIFRKDGELRWVRVTGRAIDPSDPEKGSIWAIEDIAEQKRAAAALRESEEAVRLIAENISEVFWIIEPSQERVVYLSPAFEQLWGSRPSDDRDACRTIAGWIDPDAGAPLPFASQRGSESGESVGERQITRPDGAVRWIRFRAFHIRNDHGKVHRIVGVAGDITELKLAEKERIADALRQRDVLVREVHHRIKNHLQGVIGLLKEHEADHPELRGVIGSIVGQIFSIAVVYGLYSRLGNGDVVLCDLVSEIAPTSAELARPGLEPKIEIAVPAPVKLNRDHAVPVALILNELLLNACKHGEPPITVLVAREGDATVVTVRNKCGPAAVRGDLGSEAWFGTGLGIARLLVPHDGATLTFSVSNGEFVARLALRAPVTAK